MSKQARTDYVIAARDETALATRSATTNLDKLRKRTTSATASTAEFGRGLSGASTALNMLSPNLGSAITQLGQFGNASGMVAMPLAAVATGMMYIAKACREATAELNRVIDASERFASIGRKDPVSTDRGRQLREQIKFYKQEMKDLEREGQKDWGLGFYGRQETRDRQKEAARTAIARLEGLAEEEDKIHERQQRHKEEREKRWQKHQLDSRMTFARLEQSVAAGRASEDHLARERLLMRQFEERDRIEDLPHKEALRKVHAEELAVFDAQIEAKQKAADEAKARARQEAEFASILATVKANEERQAAIERGIQAEIDLYESMEDRRIQQTGTKREQELHALDRHYQRLRERHAENADALAAIDAEYAAEKERLDKRDTSSPARMAVAVESRFLRDAPGRDPTPQWARSLEKQGLESTQVQKEMRDYLRDLATARRAPTLASAPL